MYIFFDTETNGLPKSWGASADQVDNWPRVTQLAYQIYDEEGKLIKEFASLIKPDGWTIPKEPFFIKNNMSTERSEAEGKPMSQILPSYVIHREQCKVSVAHNYSFDGPIMRAEMIRAGINKEFNSKKVCTMKASTEFCKLPGKNGYKWPKLEELHRILFGHDFYGAHDALSDVMATAKCFFELKNRNVIKL
jgi:DNA polymerase-3 subunit epsilon